MLSSRCFSKSSSLHSKNTTQNKHKQSEGGVGGGERREGEVGRIRGGGAVHVSSSLRGRRWNLPTSLSPPSPPDVTPLFLLVRPRRRKVLFAKDLVT